MRDKFMKCFYWYNRIDVQYELVKQLYRREFALLCPSWIKDPVMKKTSTRNLKCHNVAHLKFILKALEWKDRELLFNFYHSLAIYNNGIPNQTMNMNKRDNSDWNKNHHKEMCGYDFLIDIDAGSHEDIYHAQDSMIQITWLLNDFNVPYYVKFSGKGFHIVIPHNVLMERSFNVADDDNIYFNCSELAKLLHKKFSEMVDLKIYDPRRLCKLSYSLSIYENDIYVCYPLHMKHDLRNFNLEDYNLNKFDRTIQRRGVRLFNKKGGMSELLAMRHKLKSR